MFRFFIMQMKLIFKNPVKLIILAAIPLTGLLLKNSVSESETARIAVAYSVEGGGSGHDGIRKLLDKDEGMFSFREQESEEALIAAVAGEKAECGFIIPASFFEDMRKGKTKGLITLVSSPGSTLSLVAAETLYARLYPEAAKRRMGDYFTKESAIKGYSPELFDTEDVYEIYERIYTGGGTFSFDYEGGGDHVQPTKAGVALSPVRGLLAVLVMLAGLTGLMSYTGYAENPVYAKAGVRLILCLAPMLMAAAVSILTFIFVDGIPGVERTPAGICAELAHMLLYVVLCLLFMMILGSLPGMGKILPAFIPVYVLCCLVLSPVFIDAAAISPLLKKLSFLWLPGWYLN
ncbi:MAG: hypothetical protein K6B44_13315 [Lachnospiraceae bacterium]|nr:hypothetical protein [Lachnospiraceae bacterium]